jgi:hypothetical protein
MTRHTTGTRLLVLLLFVNMAVATIHGWGVLGHRLVGRIAAKHLSATATKNVSWLLGSENLADVSSWADEYLVGNNQTSYWHYINIPPDATGYDRNRDCPLQPGVAAGSRLDVWRDCVIDRIIYNEQRLADLKLDRADRAIALKFLVHFVGDLHQPFHALGVQRGGNGILVSVFGSPTCSGATGAPFPCNLHSVWDASLVAHRQLNELQYLAELDRLIKQRGWTTANPGTPDEWAMQSHALGKAALVAPQASIDEAYYQKHISVIDERLALAGLRLAALINRSLTTPPPSR